jgi:HAL2 family 3'(2'),5'-bisphosphate nucleotidase
LVLTIMSLVGNMQDESSAFSLDPSKSKASGSISVESDFPPQVQTALEGVRKAGVVTNILQASINIATVTKTDTSPVTVADFCSQAIVLKHLKENFPNDIFLAEESSDSLTPEVTKQILENVGEDLQGEDYLKECIDLGQMFFNTSEKDRARVWCLDPIDGTKGFLRKEQYCVALALLEEGVPTIGILACPNLPFDSSTKGCIFVACKGGGCYQLHMEQDQGKLLRLEESNSAYDLSKARFCVNVSQSFADPVGKCKEMARLLHGGLDETGEIIYSTRMDSQAKYGVVARGDAEFYVRLPKADHREWIWDVAPGVLVLEEIGGVVTDINGDALDFSVGAKLATNGVLGARDPKLHEALLEVYRK